MDGEWLKCITSSLHRYQLTIRENLFVESVERCFNEKGVRKSSNLDIVPVCGLVGGIVKGLEAR